MKFFLLAALIACAYAEPEADAYYAGAYGYGTYGAYRLHKRDAEAEPKADAYYGGLYGYTGYGLGSYGYSSYAAAPYTSYGYAAPAYYGNYAHGAYRLAKRDAEAEPKADAYYAGVYGYPGYAYSGHRSYPYTYGSYAYPAYSRYY